MTSRVSFYKVMLEDLRHRVWMIALSYLGSFLALPVTFLLLKQEWDDRILRFYENIETDYLLEISEYKTNMIHEFYTGTLSMTCGFILVLGALIVGIFGFRHVHSKKMVDQYHSIPIKRSHLFLANYLNGFLIWFVPMLIGAVICSILSAFFLQDFVAWIHSIGVLITVILNFILSFLTVYHLAIVAVMLSGNIINTLVSGTILGLGVVGIYSMLVGFADHYFHTYYQFFEKDIFKIFWASPLAGAIYQLTIPSLMEELERGSVILHIILSVILVVLMWVAGFLLYVKRPSELAEQGLKIKPVQMIFKTVTAVLGGMCGWIIFDFISGSLVWMIFGAVLVGGLTYGVLDIIFHMEFKAFFHHKIQMVFTVLCAIFIGCVFHFDMTGYDTYLPEKYEIADIGIYVRGLSQYNMRVSYQSLSEKEHIDRMSYTNQDAIYTFLEEMTLRAGNDQIYPVDGRSSIAYVRVTETSGKTYYRMYRVWEQDKEIMRPILTDKSFVEENILIPQEVLEHIIVDKYNVLTLGNFKDGFGISEREKVQEILKAYNQDMLENYAAYLYEEGDVLCNMDYWASQNEFYFSFDGSIYSSMAHTVDVLRNYGYLDQLTVPKAEDIKRITIENYQYEEGQSLEEIFGLVDKEQSAAEEVWSADGTVEIATQETKWGENFYRAVFEDQESIELLIPVLCFNRPNGTGLFGSRYVDCNVRVEFKNGIEYYIYMKEGMMPKELLQEFRLVE